MKSVASHTNADRVALMVVAFVAISVLEKLTGALASRMKQGNAMGDGLCLKEQRTTLRAVLDGSVAAIAVRSVL